MSANNSVKLTLRVNRAIAVLLLVLSVCMPALLRWYMSVRALDDAVIVAIGIAFYCCLPAVVLALWKMEQLLKNLLSGEIFVSRNVRCIRTVRWCCMTVSLICLPAAFFYPPLILMVAIMGFLTLMVTVVGQVMKTAVEIREENDLTI